MKTLKNINISGITLLTKKAQETITGKGMTERSLCEEDYSGCQFIDHICVC